MKIGKLSFERLAADEEYKGIPTIKITATDIETGEIISVAYLSQFRRYRFQVSGTPDDDGDFGASEVFGCGLDKFFSDARSMIDTAYDHGDHYLFQQNKEEHIDALTVDFINQIMEDQVTVAVARYARGLHVKKHSKDTAILAADVNFDLWDRDSMWSHFFRDTYNYIMRNPDIEKDNYKQHYPEYYTK